MNTLRILSMALLLAALTAGCGGGGGGGGGGGSNDDVTLEPLVIDQNNAMQVTAAVGDVVGSVLDFSSEGGVILAAAVVPGNGAATFPSPSSLSDIIHSQLDRFALLQTQTADFQIAAIVIEPTTEDCFVRGTYTVSGKIADETVTSLSVGDTMNISYSDCDDGDGEVMNGSLEIIVVEGVVDFDFTPPYDYTMDTLVSLSVTEPGETYTANGDLTLHEATADGLFIETGISGKRLTITESGVNETLGDYWIQSTLDVGAGDAYTAFSSGLNDCCATLESTLLGGAVDFRNTELFKGVGDDFPYAGSLLVTGAVSPSGIGTTSVELIVRDDLCVDLHVDEDGDGVDDVVITTTWESLPNGTPVDCDM